MGRFLIGFIRTRGGKSSVGSFILVISCSTASLFHDSMLPLFLIRVEGIIPSMQHAVRAKLSLERLWSGQIKKLVPSSSFIASYHSISGESGLDICYFLKNSICRRDSPFYFFTLHPIASSSAHSLSDHIHRVELLCCCLLQDTKTRIFCDHCHLLLSLS